MTPIRPPGTYPPHNPYAAVPQATPLQGRKVDPHPEKSLTFKDVIKKISKIAALLLVVPAVVAGVALIVAKKLSLSATPFSPLDKIATKIRAFVLQWVLIPPLASSLFGTKQAANIFSIKSLFDAAAPADLDANKTQNLKKAFDLIETACKSGNKTSLYEAMILLVENGYMDLVKPVSQILLEAGLLTQPIKESLEQLTANPHQPDPRPLDIHKAFNPNISEVICRLCIDLKISPDDVPLRQQTSVKLAPVLAQDKAKVIQGTQAFVSTPNLLNIGENPIERAEKLKSHKEITIGDETVAVCRQVYVDFFNGNSRALYTFVEFKATSPIRLDTKEHVTEFYGKIKDLAGKMQPNATPEEKNKLINILMFYCTQYTTNFFVAPIITQVTSSLAVHAPDFSPIANDYRITLSAIEENGQTSPTKFKVALTSTVGVRPYKIPADQGVKDRAVQSQELTKAGLGSCCDYIINAEFIVDLATTNPTASVTRCEIQ